MDANKALELGFVDGILEREPTPLAQRMEEIEALAATPDETEPAENANGTPKSSMLFSRKAVECALVNKLRHRMIAEAAKIQPKETPPTGRKVKDLYERLNLLKN